MAPICKSSARHNTPVLSRRRRAGVRLNCLQALCTVDTTTALFHRQGQSWTAPCPGMGGPSLPGIRWSPQRSPYHPIRIFSVRVLTRACKYFRLLLKHYRPCIAKPPQDPRVFPCVPPLSVCGRRLPPRPQEFCLNTCHTHLRHTPTQQPPSSYTRAGAAALTNALLSVLHPRLTRASGWPSPARPSHHAAPPPGKVFSLTPLQNFCVRTKK